MNYTKFMEALKGKQHKIDKNKNGKVDAHDFKLLRKEEAEQLDEVGDTKKGQKLLQKVNKRAVERLLSKKADKDPAYARRAMDTHLAADSRLKEDLSEATVKTQKYSWGTMKTVHHGADFSIPLHPEHHQAIAKLKDEQEHKFKTEDGKHWTARRKGDDVHFQSANDGPKTTVKHSTMSEEVELEEKMTDSQKYAVKALLKAKHGKETPTTTQAKKAIGFVKTNEEVEELDEKSAQAHNKSIGRALRSEDKMTTQKDKNGKLISFKYEGDWKKSTEKKQGSGKAANLAGQAMQKMAKANEQAPVAPVPDRKYIKGTPENKALKAARKPINGMPTNKIKEEKDEQEYDYEGQMARTQLQTTMRNCQDLIGMIEDDENMPEWVQSKITLAQDYITTVRDYLQSKEELGEEVVAEGLVKNIKRLTTGKDVKSRARQEIAKSQDASMKGDLKTSKKHFDRYDKLDKLANEAKSVEVKVNHALEAPHEEEWEDTGICPEHNKKDCHQCGKAGMKEHVQEIQEKSDQAKQNKTMKNVMAASKGAKLNRDSGLKLTPGDTGHSNAQQMNKALGRHAMRENEGLKSYKEFMMMLEYESDKSGSYTHKGSYGSEFAKKEREKDEKGFDSENEPTKRGPKMGSKRGPKANLGSSKLHTK